MMNSSQSFITVLILCSLSLQSSCTQTNSNTETAEIAHQVGEVMASIDEMSGSSNGELSFYSPKSELNFISSAYAASCLNTPTFSSCSGGSLTRTFSNCTIGTRSVNGQITLSWSTGSCSLGASAGASITRVPSFTVTGRRNATLSVSKTGSIGQRLTWTTGAAQNKTFSFLSDGIRRTLTSSDGTVLADFSTSTQTPLTLTGTSRSSLRVITGGTIRVNNLLTSQYCDFSPTTVAWSSNCNCPVSGSWSASCSDGKTGTLTLLGCGGASLNLGVEIIEVNLDRCSSL